MRAFLRIFLLILFLLIAFAGIAIYWTFYKPVANYNKTYTLDDIHSEVAIYRDEFAIPHIHADNFEDLYFAAGFVHAQDRLWQMTLMQLMTEGRFAEFFGEELIDTDRMLRVLGFYRVSVESYDLLSEEHKNHLIAYSNGVNAWMSNNLRNLPIEFTLSGVKPIPWTPVHSLAIFRLMGWELNQSWWAKSVLHQLETELSPVDFQNMLPHYYSDLTGSVRYSDSGPLQDFFQADWDMRQKLQFEGFGAGSNGWAVDGSKTANGYPILAGDPHLGLAMPARWYEIHYVLNGKNLSGATIAGNPLVLLGQNEYAAWTLTNVMLDDTDFFLIADDPMDRGRYVTDSTATNIQYAQYDIKREIIKVKDSDEVLHQVRYTEFGPLINDIHENDTFFDRGKFAAKWTGFTASNEYAPVFTLNWSENFQEIQSELAKISSPSQNVIYADVTGNIAHFVTGNVPIRNRPLSLRRSWVPQDRWQGFVPFDQLPHQINPERGWVGNANQRIGRANYPHYISAFWHPEARMHRITELLEAKNSFTVEDFMDMQNDTYSVFAENIVNAILPVISELEDSLIVQAVPYLSNWDYHYERNEVAASITDVFMQRMAHHLFSEKLSESAYLNYTRSSLSVLNRMYHAIQANNDTLLPAAHRDSLIALSVKESISFLSDSLSTRTYQWRWENLHKLHLRAPLFKEAAKEGGAIRLIHNNILARGPFQRDGSTTTLNLGSYRFDTPFDVVLGPSVRRIVDLSTMRQSFSSLPGGQSGNPLSSYYDDQLRSWLNGTYKVFLHDHRLMQNYVKYTTILKSGADE